MIHLNRPNQGRVAGAVHRLDAHGEPTRTFGEYQRPVALGDDMSGVFNDHLDSAVPAQTIGTF